MPQLTTAPARAREYRRDRGTGTRDGGSDWEGADELMDRKEEERSEGVQRSRRMNALWRPWPGWCCLGPVAAVWFVLQEEAPLYPSLSPAEVCWRLLLAGGLWGALGLCVLLHRRSRQRRGAPSQRREVVVRKSITHQQARMAGVMAADQPVPVSHALTASLLLCLLHEPMKDPSPPHIQALLGRLEAVSWALQRADLQDPLLQGGNQGGQQNDDDLALKDLVKRISTYLQDRIQALLFLLQAQCEYEASVSDAQQGLQQHWGLLEELHARVTLSPEWRQGPEDPGTVLRDTECLFTELGQFKSRLKQCQTHLSMSTYLLQELDRGLQGMAESVGTGVESAWTTDLRQSNAEQFDEVHQDFTSLEQQTSTFVTHLRGLRVPGEEEEELRRSRSSAPPSFPVHCSAALPESSAPEPSPRVPPAAERTATKRLSAKDLLCAVRRRK